MGAPSSDGWHPEEVKSLMEMASAGLGIDAIALELKRSKSAIRDFAHHLRIPLEEIDRPLVCPRCGHGYVVGLNDWCSGCELEIKRAQWDAEQEEEVRRLKEIDREDSRIRKAREREREKHGTNPRKGKRKQ